MNRWDIYWARVPFSDCPEKSKVRPVVILNDRTAFIVGYGIYSASPRPLSVDYMIADWKAAGLDHQSTIQTDRAVRIDKADLQERIGRLSARDILLLEHRFSIAR